MSRTICERLRGRGLPTAEPGVGRLMVLVAACLTGLCAVANGDGKDFWEDEDCRATVDRPCVVTSECSTLENLADESYLSNITKFDVTQHPFVDRDGRCKARIVIKWSATLNENYRKLDAEDYINNEEYGIDDDDEDYGADDDEEEEYYYVPQQIYGGTQIRYYEVDVLGKDPLVCRTISIIPDCLNYTLDINRELDFSYECVKVLPQKELFVQLRSLSSKDSDKPISRRLTTQMCTGTMPASTERPFNAMLDADGPRISPDTKSMDRILGLLSSLRTMPTFTEGPFSGVFVLDTDGPRGPDTEPTDRTYILIVAKIVILGITGALFIAFAVVFRTRSLQMSIVSKKLDNATVEEWHKVKRILKYLNDTVNFGILYHHSGPVEIKAFSDAGCAQDTETCRSISGSVC